MVGTCRLDITNLLMLVPQLCRWVLVVAADWLRGSCGYILDSLRILHDPLYSKIRVKYHQRLLRNVGVIAKVGCLWCGVMFFISPDVRTPSVMWVSCVGGTYFLIPSRPEIASWAIVGMSIFTTLLCLLDNPEEYFRQGITYVNVASTLMIFFAGLGARGAGTFAAALAIMFSMTASSSVLALNICVACFAQIVLYIILEVSLLYTLFEIETLVVQRAVEEKKASFMAIVSHELKSPLHGIIGLSSGLVDTPHLSNTAEKHVALILSCARRLLDLVTNIMDATVLVQEKQMKFSRDQVRLDVLVEEVVILCQHAVDRRGQPLVRDGVALINNVGRLPEIEADRHRCSQLFYNLVNNALKFTHEGSVQISGHVDKDANTVVLSVADTGIGIAPENHERVFQTFQQEDVSERRQYEGLGLGLSICREVATRHGGTLTVESSPGEGSTFRVTLPFRMTTPSPPKEQRLACEELPVRLAATGAAQTLSGTPKEGPSTHSQSLDGTAAAAPVQVPCRNIASASSEVVQRGEENQRATQRVSHRHLVSSPSVMCQATSLQHVAAEAEPVGAQPVAGFTFGRMSGGVLGPCVEKPYSWMLNSCMHHPSTDLRQRKQKQGDPGTLLDDFHSWKINQQKAQQSTDFQQHQQKEGIVGQLVDEPYQQMAHQSIDVQKDVERQGDPGPLVGESYFQKFNQQLAHQAMELQKHEHRLAAMQLHLRQHEVLLESLEKRPYLPSHGNHDRLLPEGLHHQVASLSQTLATWMRDLALCNERIRNDVADICHVRQQFALHSSRWDARSHAFVQQEKWMTHNLLQIQHIGRDLTKAEVAIAKHAEQTARLQNLPNLCRW